MSTSSKPHHWRVNIYRAACTECGEVIGVGELAAVYREELAPEVLTGERHRFFRIYCAECGHLLEYSLTTTEDL
jgi:ribosomal protein S27E